MRTEIEVPLVELTFGRTAASIGLGVVVGVVAIGVIALVAAADADAVHDDQNDLSLLLMSARALEGLAHDAALSHPRVAGLDEPFLGLMPDLLAGVTTERLRDALALVDIRVLDHLVVGDGEVSSFAERGLL